MTPDMSKELLFEHFSHNTTPLQRRQIEEWLKADENEELYYKWVDEWENLNPEYQPDSIILGEKFTLFLSENAPNTEGVSPAETPNWFRFRRYIGIAASLFLLICATTWLFQDSIFHQKYKTDFGEVKTFVLPDGTQVTLNANSFLKLPRWGFGSDNRDVFLKGEASFSVTHLPNNQKFRVKTDKAFDVVVLGTEFSVFSRERGARVVLNKGKVQLNYKDGEAVKTVEMKPGEQVLLDKNQKITQKKLKETQLTPAWQEKRFVFDEITLAEAGAMIEESYGLTVKIADAQLAKRELMGSFRAESVEELLQTLGDLLEIKVLKQGETVYFLEK